MITVLADRHIPFLNDYLSDGVRIVTFDPVQPLPADCPADALLVRTVTRVHQGTLPPLLLRTLRFVGTASSGTDHIDKAFLKQAGIAFASAAGCNAQAVAEYVGSALVHWCAFNRTPPYRYKIGVVGAGHTGSATAAMIRLLAGDVVVHDPPRAAVDPGFSSATKEEILDCDIISFHVPLIETENHPDGFPVTRHWLGQKELREREFSLIINASRGGVVDETALKLAYGAARLQDYVLDVWEGEPVPVAAVLEDAWVGTPHIAGYSVEAKIKGTTMVMDELYRFFSLQPPAFPQALFDTLHQANFTKMQAYLDSLDRTSIRHLPETLAPIMETLHPMFALSNSLKAGVHMDEREMAALFQHLRTSHPLRSEYKGLQSPERMDRRFRGLRRILQCE